MPASHALTSVCFFYLFAKDDDDDGIQNDTKTSHPQITMVSDPHIKKMKSQSLYMHLRGRHDMCPPQKTA